MDSFEVYQFIDIIGGEKSKNEKIFLLEEFLEDDVFRKVIEYTYDPHITFGVLKIPEVDPGIDNFSNDTWDLLNGLKDRVFTGNVAKELIKEEMGKLNKESQTLFKRIVKKDLRAGFSAVSINKAMEDLIPIQPYMRCSLPSEVDLSKFDWEHGVFSQKKADGMFANVDVNKELIIRTRNGLPFPRNFDPVTDALRKLRKGYQYHGEFVIYVDDQLLPRKVSNGIMNRLRQGGPTKLDGLVFIQFIMWDMIPLSAVQTKFALTIPYDARFGMLLASRNSLEDVDRLHIKTIDTKIVKSYVEAQEHFLEEVEQGYEGTVFKDPNSLWKHGDSKWQIKLKDTKICELKIIGFVEGTGKNADTFGSITCVSDDYDIQVDVSGISDKKRLEIFNNQDRYLNSIISVKFNEVIDNKITGGLSLFLPRFDEERPDKTEADTAEKILAM